MPYGPIQKGSLFDPSLLLGIPMCRPALSNYSPLPAETPVPRKVLDSLSFSPIRKVWAFLVQSGEMGLCCVEGETSRKGMEGPA